MSLIADALKTAQREKQRRESGGGISPVLVPLRAQAEPSSTRQKVTMAISVLVIIGSSVVLVQRLRGVLARPAAVPEAPRSQSAMAPVPNRATRPLDDARPPGATSIVPSSPIPEAARAPRPTSAVPRRTAPSRAAGGSLPPSARRDTAVVESGDRNVQSAGRLRIAVEQPRAADAARLFAEALAAHRANDLAAARTLYERVLLLAPNDADALNNLGVLLSSLREFDRALDLLRRAASIAPNNAGTWNNIGTALREQGRGADAIAAFRHALTIEPQHQSAKVGLAQQLLTTGPVSQARALLEEVLAVNPDLPEARYALGQALEMQGDRAGAIREYSAFIRLAPARLAGHVERTRRHVDSLSRAR